MKKILLVIIALLILAAGAFFLYVSMIDWNSHKDRIATQFSNVTGKEVVFDGPVSFKVFPSPYLSAQNIKIYNKNARNEAPLATISEMMVDISLASLFKGDFDVNRMVIVKPEINLEILPEGKINWQSKVDYDSPQNIDVILDSVTIKDAKLNIVSKQDDINITLNNLNAEVIGDSIFGPYRIEGTYIKNNDPEGFALSLGRFSDSFATSLNLAILHPASETHLRFDGTFFLKNSSINGNLVFESNKFVEFLDKYLNIKVSENYDYPLAISTEINTNKTKVDISSFIVKYGETQGAGNILIPLDENGGKTNIYSEYEDNRLKAEIGFNMTDLDLNPIVQLTKDFVKAHENKGKDLSFDLGYDVLFDLKSVRTTYNEQNIRDFKISFDILEDEIVINSLGAILPGDTSLTTKGKIYSYEDELTYSFDVVQNSLDTMKLLQWMGQDIKSTNQYIYRNSEFTGPIQGTMQNMKVGPFNAKLDKTTVDGEAGIIFGMRPKALINIKADTINFDNYIEKMPDNIENAGIKSHVEYTLDKLSFLNDYDVQLYATLDTGIYLKTPFEGNEIAITTSNGKINVENLSILSIANSTVKLQGEILGTGNNLTFNNVKYDVSTQDFYSLFNKENLPKALAEIDDLKKIELKGLISGNFNRIITKSVIKMENIDLAYMGEVAKKDDEFVYKGNFEFKTPDFIRFVNRFNVQYNPKSISLGIFNIKAQLNGTKNRFKMTDIDANIGANNFKGALTFDGNKEKPIINAKLKANRFEIDRFFYNNYRNVNSQNTSFITQKEKELTFIERYDWDKVNNDFSWFEKAIINAELNFDSLTYQKYQLTDVALRMSAVNDTVKISRFEAKYMERDINLNTTISLIGNKNISGMLKIKNVKLAENLPENIYGISSENSEFDFVFNSLAKSDYDFATKLNGKLTFNIDKPTIKGWELDEIEKDLKQRNTPDGLSDLVQTMLQTGITEFDNVQGVINFDNGKYTTQDIVFTAQAYEVDMEAEGIIETGEINSQFVLNYKYLNNMPDIKYDMTGALDKIALNVNVSEIENIYKTQIKDKEEKEQAKEKARVDNLEILAGQQEDKAAEIFEILREKKDFIDARLSIAENGAIIKAYNDLMTSLIKTEGNLDTVINLKNIEGKELNDAAIKSAEEINDKSERELLIYSEALDAVYLQDIKDTLNRRYNILANKYKVSRSDITKYRDNYIMYPRRMAIIGDFYSLDKDEEINLYREKIEETFTSLDEKNTEAAKDYVAIQTLTDVKDIERYIDKAGNLIDEYDAEEDMLNQNIKELMEYLENKVSNAEKEYDKMVEEELEKQKIEENKGSISSSTGKSVTIVNDVEKTNDEDIPVLDFSSPKKTESKIKTNSKNIMTREEINLAVESKEKNILKEADSDIYETSGSISRK